MSNEMRKLPTRPGWWWARWNNPHANPTAEWSAALADWDEFPTTACGWRMEDADLALRAAIRAERDGAA